MDITLPTLAEREAFRQLAIDEAEARALAIQAKEDAKIAARAAAFASRVNERATYAAQGLIAAVQRGETQIFLPIEARVRGEDRADRSNFVRAVQNTLTDAINANPGYTAINEFMDYENINNYPEGTGISPSSLRYWGVLVTWT